MSTVNCTVKKTDKKLLSYGQTGFLLRKNDHWFSWIWPGKVLDRTVREPAKIRLWRHMKELREQKGMCLQGLS